MVEPLRILFCYWQICLAKPAEFFAQFFLTKSESVEEGFPGAAFSLFQSGSYKINPPRKNKTIHFMKTKIRTSVSHLLALITYHCPATLKVKACSPRRAATEGGSATPKPGEGGSPITILRWRRPAAARPLIPLVLVCFALLPRAQAVVPAPDGGYPGQQHG